METPKRNLRIPDDLWNRAHERAKQDGIPVAEVVREVLKQYIDGKLTPTPEQRHLDIMRAAITDLTTALDYFDYARTPDTDDDTTDI